MRQAAAPPHVTTATNVRLPSAARPVRRATRATRRPAASNCSSSSTPRLAEQIAELFESGEGHAFVYRNALLSANVSYQNDFHTLSGQSQYLKAATAWFTRQKRLLPHVSSQIISVSQLSQDQLIVKWKVSWIRPAGFWLYQLGTTLPGLQLEYKDILHKVAQPSSISWDGIKRVLGRIASERVVEVPLAVVQGSSRLLFAASRAGSATSSSTGDSSSSSSSSGNGGGDGGGDGGGGDGASMKLVRCVEQLELVPLFESGEVKNRTITRDVLLFQLVRQPPGRETGEWMAAVNERLATSRVPGMGPLEVDGIGSEQQAQLYDDATSILAYVTFCVVVLSGAIAYTYFSRLTRF